MNLRFRCCKKAGSLLAATVALLISTGSGVGQTLSATNPSREFIRLGGQLVATENNVQGQTGPAAGYGYVRTLTLDGTKSKSDLTNFPVLLSITLASFASSANGGHIQNQNAYDILFTSDRAGMNRLNWELESYDAANGTIVAWIQLPTLKHGVTTPIYLFYGNPYVTTDQSGRSATWDSTFSAVYHFESGAAFAEDSTRNANSGMVNAVASGTGEIALGANFASGGYVSVPDSTLLDQSTGTWEFWFRDDGPPIIPGAQRRVVRTPWIDPASPKFQNYCAAVLTKADTHDSINGIGFATCNGALFVQAKSSTGGTQTANIYTTAGWHHTAFTFTSGVSYNYYSDGALLDSGPLVLFTISSAEPLRIGHSLTPAWPQAYIGLLDEVRLSHVVRSPDWVATEYYNQSSPAAFVTVGAEQ